MCVYIMYVIIYYYKVSLPWQFFEINYIIFKMLNILFYFFK